MVKKLKFRDVKEDLYYIFDDGRIWSTYLKKFLSPFFDRYGYLQVSLQNTSNKKKHYYVAQIVAYSYLGAPPQTMKDPTVDHLDEDKLNNKYTNLQWVPRQENLRRRAKKSSFSALTENDVHSICKDLEKDMRQIDIARKYNVHKGTIFNILNDICYKHISCNYNFSKRKHK